MSAQRDVANVRGVNWQLDGLMLEVKFAAIAFTGTAQDVVAAVTGKKIRVLSAQFTLTGNVDNTAAFYSNGVAGTLLSGLLQPLALQTDAGGAAMVMISGKYHPYGAFETKSGEKLTVDGAGTTPVGEGFLTYVEIPA